MVASLIPEGSEVVDLCAGDGELRRHLPESTRYTAVDMNVPFLRHLRRRGVDTVVADLRATIPTGDVVVMMASLYHFVPDHVALVKRAKGAARKRFILTEPVENVTASRHALISKAAAFASDPGDGTSHARLGVDDLQQLLRDVPGGSVTHRTREWVMVWDNAVVSPQPA
jgi:trans-aconitate methyltransferase